MIDIKTTQLYKKITSKENIFTAIYSVESYIFERQLLDEEDITLLNALVDRYNDKIICEVIERCEKKLEDILCNKDSLFNVSVYFKFKKIDRNDQGEFVAKSRPIHSADLISQICIVCMLNILMFEDSPEKGRQLSEISNMLPSYFYGNIPSTDIDNLFIPWIKKYKEYTQDVIEGFHNYKENKRYKYEITLDIQNFFPSINPNIIYKLIKNSFAHLYPESELDCLDQVLFKLLYFKLSIDPEDYYEYYGKVVNEEKYDEFIGNADFYTLGIPQGLPQSYFFGNLCMIQVDSFIKREIEGEFFYYVDDSTIFSNTDFSNPQTFRICINNINKYLEEYCKKDKETPYIACQKFNSYLNYLIRIHEEEKSTCEDITTKDDEWGGIFFIAKQASVISHDLFSSIDDSDDYTLKEKVEALLNEINQEIIRLKKHENESATKYKNRIKLLIRYKKFYSFRLLLLKLHESKGDNLYDGMDDNEEKDYNTRYCDILKNEDPKILNECKELVEEDIFWAESLLMIKNLKSNKKKQKELTNNIIAFERKLFGEKLKSLYYKKYINGLKLELSLINDVYKSLSSKIKIYFPDYRSINTSYLKTEIDSYLNKYIVSSNALNAVNEILNIKGSYNNFVFKYSVSYQRRFLNTLFSHLFSVPISDEGNIIKINGQSIRYFELRILVLLRNSRFHLETFKEKIHHIITDIDNNGYQKIDLTLLDVLPIFRKHVAEPKDIDRLILLHKYVNSLWKNGSKFLYFYTLHNEEHSVELIKLVTKLMRAINFLTLKQSDYFILFSACYLHDISMVIYPDIYQFIPDKKKSEQIYTIFKERLKKIDNYQDIKYRDEIKKFIVDNYQDVNNFFETKIREEHAKLSANFIIKKNKEIDSILIGPEKKYIAEVSESHGYNTYDIYGLKSTAKSDIINLKYLMILLRLADLMDMVKDRVSINILKQNIKYMPSESKFHWISHLVTDKCEIKSNYYHNPSNVNKYCQNGSVVEEFIVELTLNMKRLQNVNTINRCSYMSCQLDKTNQKLEIEIHEDSTKQEFENCSNCYFLCKWMRVKNQYLFDELYDLQRYLNRNINNLFKSKIKVVLNYEDLNSISAEYIDIVRNRIS
ncbi:HD domain-containing protein [Gabonibacter massiliensis]|uniref:HD domain-containing protein n=1 Tax=Gabonibacter massiliensis TaxID=1720195 RepID=UPI00073F207C|nr:reverse transcriptase domain-containing protein [Gabonibacter massiliensis]